MAGKRGPHFVGTGARKGEGRAMTIPAAKVEERFTNLAHEILYPKLMPHVLEAYQIAARDKLAMRLADLVREQRLEVLTKCAENHCYCEELKGKAKCWIHNDIAALSAPSEAQHD